MLQLLISPLAAKYDIPLFGLYEKSFFVNIRNENHPKGQPGLLYALSDVMRLDPAVHQSALAALQVLSRVRA